MPAVTQKLNTDAYKYALPGGASKEANAQNELAAHVTAKRFLTRVRSQRVRVDAKMVLTYWHTSSETAFNVRFDAVKTDGTAVNAVPVVKTSVASHSLWCIDCSPSKVATALGITADLIASYSVVIIDISSPGMYHSEFYHFTLEDGAARDYMQLLYQNSFGVYEFFELRGMISKETSAKVERVTLLKNNPARDVPVNFTLNQQSLDSWKVSTGFLTRTEVEQLKEVLRSPDVYMLTATHHMPISIVGHSNDLWDTDSGTLNGMELTLTQEQPDSYA